MPTQFVERFIALNTCDGYVVLTVDPDTHEADAHGPYDGLTATTIADQMRNDLDADGLTDVSVAVIRLHQPRPQPGGHN